MKLSEEQRTDLEAYKQCADGGGFALQRLQNASALCKAGLLDWKGESFGCSFYAITDTGRLALRTREPDHA